MHKLIEIIKSIICLVQVFLFFFLLLVSSLVWVSDDASEQYDLVGVVPDDEDKRVIGYERLCRKVEVFRNGEARHRCCFRTFFVHLDECSLSDAADVQVLFFRDAG